MIEIYNLYSEGMSPYTISLVYDIDIEEVLSIIEEVNENKEAIA